MKQAKGYCADCQQFLVNGGNICTQCLYDRMQSKERRHMIKTGQERRRSRAGKHNNFVQREP